PSRRVISGISSPSRSTVRNASNQRYPSSLRAQTPTLALPPLSPDLAPNTVPSGSRRVGPKSAGSGRPSSAFSSCGGRRGGSTTSSRRPPSNTTVWVTTSADTSAGQKTPYVVSASGGLVVKKPG